MKNTLICAKKAVNISTHNVITKGFCRLSAIFRLKNRYIKKGKRPREEEYRSRSVKI